MHNQNWLEELAVELRRKKLPPGYISRLMDELSDHVQDIQEEKIR